MQLLIDRYGIHIGDLLYLRFYGLIIMVGVIAAGALAMRQAKKWGKDPEFVYDMLPWLLVFGIIGARLWHVFTPSQASGLTVGYYLSNPLQILMIWKGGLGIPGAVIGGALALYLYTRRRSQSFALWADIAAPGLLLAQAIGRWGNFVNQELYGAPTDLPWAIFIEPANRTVPGYESVAYYHPLFLYESLWNLINVGILLWIGNRNRSRLLPGDIFLFYLVLYPFTRFVLEFLRLDPSLVGGINANQTVMAIIALAAAISLVWRHGSRRRRVELVEQRSE